LTIAGECLKMAHETAPKFGRWERSQKKAKPPGHRTLAPQINGGTIDRLH
jgi:hypothetical protein